MKIDGIYEVTFMSPNDYIDACNFKVFVGVCSNFTISGRCTFFNHKDEWLIVDNSHIVQMRLLDDDEK